MKFLADENIFPKITAHLRDKGHDVKSLQEEGIFKSIDDEVMRMAKEEDRTVITFDKHFGNILKYPPGKTSGIIHIRIHPPLLEYILPSLDLLLNQYKSPSFSGKLIILERNGYRIRS
ncbi:MAG: DUF5615 family PIN-like protein [Nitrospirae bacterium]|nr:DUF5615 family PIN-like protein [Nitrospirota bacterium]